MNEKIRLMEKELKKQKQNINCKFFEREEKEYV